MRHAETEDTALVRALRAGDEAAFATLVRTHGPAMLRLAMSHVRNRAVAQEVVQDAWLGILQSLPRFEERSSLRTWMFRIVRNRAISRARTEGRSIPASALGGDDDDAPAVDPGRFLPLDDPENPGAWRSAPPRWDGIPEDRLLSAETREVVMSVVDALPPGQRTVLVLRDIEGWSPQEVAALLDVSDVHQRVLLHRARAKVRTALESYLQEAGA